jgi:hypothetical protein
LETNTAGAWLRSGLHAPGKLKRDVAGNLQTYPAINFQQLSERRRETFAVKVFS